MAASDYLTLGRGELYFAPFAAGTKVPGALKFLGNCPAFTLSVSVETLEHMDSTSGMREEDLSVIVSRQFTGSIECDDIKPDNIAKFFLGTSSALTVSAATGLDSDLPGAEFDGTFQIGITAAKPTGDRQLANVVVTDTATGLVTYVLGTDYTLDAERGLITFISGGTITEGTLPSVDYDILASTRTQVVSGEVQIEGELFFKANNPTGTNIDRRMPFAQLAPSGDMAMIGDDWSTISLDVKLMTLSGKEAIYNDTPAVV